MLNGFGKKVRKGRIDASVSLADMANELETTPAFLSGMETGRKKIPAGWPKKIEKYFESKGVLILGLEEEADVANNSVPLESHLSGEHKLMIAGFAKVKSSAISEADANTLRKLLAKYKDNS